MKTAEQKIVDGLQKFAEHLESGKTLEEWKDQTEIKKALMKRDYIERVFSYNEVYGPFACEVCGEEAWFIVISKQEVDDLPEGDRFDQSCYVMTKNLGKALCKEHLKEG